MVDFPMPEGSSNLNNSNQRPSFWSGVLEMVKVVVVSLVIIIPIRMFIFQPFVVEGASMEPNFQDKQYLIIDEITQRFESYTRGQVVVFHPPTNPSVYYIKRVIGLPGETVEFKDAHITIYNQVHPQGFVLDENAYLPSSEIDAFYQNKITLGNNEYYVLGDNRNNSLDSRRIGPIPADHIKGRVLVRAWPVSKFVIFGNPTYNQ